MGPVLEMISSGLVINIFCLNLAMFWTTLGDLPDKFLLQELASIPSLLHLGVHGHLMEERFCVCSSGVKQNAGNHQTMDVLSVSDIPLHAM